MAPHFWKMSKGKKNRGETPGDGEEARGDRLAGVGRGGDVGSLVKGPWSPEEDKRLRKLVRKNGCKKWEELGKLMNRTGKSCRLRWHNQLKPGVRPVAKYKFTAEEDERLRKLHKEHGNKWSLIARMLPGRTDNQVKNRCNSALVQDRHQRVHQVQRKRAEVEGLPAADPPQFFGGIEGARSLLEPVAAGPTVGPAVGPLGVVPRVGHVHAGFGADEAPSFMFAHLRRLKEHIAREEELQRGKSSGEGEGASARGTQMFGPFRWIE